MAASPPPTPWIALVGPELEENLSLRYLASSLEAGGYRVEILPFHAVEHFSSVLSAVLEAKGAPLLVGLSLAFQWKATDMLALALALREGGYDGHITAGGHFATFAAEELLSDFAELTSICRQEAEDTIVALARALEDGTALEHIPGLALRSADGAVFKTPLPKNPDIHALPWPDRRGEPARCFGHAISPLVGSRGCYANCTFCCIAAWHEQTLPGKRYRMREPADIADEMVAMQRERGVEIFVFHDDNFFMPKKEDNLARFHALADALEERGMGRFATVVKARPTDVKRELFEVLKERLHCIRCYVGVETDSEQGLETLRRWARPRQNRHAIEVVRSLELYTCFNMLVFDPDTTLESLKTNIDFMDFAAELPSNFGRVELYAGTPLLQRMQREGRVRGDYLQWDYDLGDPAIERVFHLAMRAFHVRNFTKAALNNHIMGLRFDVEVARHFHPEVFERAWWEEATALTAELTRDSVAGLRHIVEHVESGAAPSSDAAVVGALSERLRAAEADIWGRGLDLAARMTRKIGRGAPLTELGDKVATPLQRAVAEVA